MSQIKRYLAVCDELRDANPDRIMANYLKEGKRIKAINQVQRPQRSRESWESTGTNYAKKKEKIEAEKYANYMKSREGRQYRHSQAQRKETAEARLFNKKVKAGQGDLRRARANLFAKHGVYYKS